MRVDLFDYELPADRIAQVPASPRDASRLLVLHRRNGLIDHRRFHELGQYLAAGDCLVLNDTRVLPARLTGRRKATGGKWTGLFLREHDGHWLIAAQTRGKPRPGERIVVDPAGWELELVSRADDGTWLAQPPSPDTAYLLASSGRMPLPPYIHKGIDRPLDQSHYQTVYARQPGAVAAPTAGLHFTETLLERLARQGVAIVFVTLHVGLGTFQKVSAADTENHKMHAEWRTITAETVSRLNETRATGGRIVAVGTTVARVLESATDSAGKLRACDGETRLFIAPPYEFRSVDMLLTNFHLPRSTLLMLVSAFAGLQAIQDAYAQAVQAEYRFYSYGDAMLIV